MLCRPKAHTKRQHETLKKMNAGLHHGATRVVRASTVSLLMWELSCALRAGGMHDVCLVSLLLCACVDGLLTAACICMHATSSPH